MCCGGRRELKLVNGSDKEMWGKVGRGGMCGDWGAREGSGCGVRSVYLAVFGVGLWQGAPFTCSTSSCLFLIVAYCAAMRVLVRPLRRAV